MDSNKTDLPAVQEDPVNEAVNVQNEINNNNKFETLIDLVNTSFAEVQSGTQDLLLLKDDLFMQFLPPTLQFKIAVVFGNMYRSLSDLNTPVSELLRLVKIYSASWEKNSALLKKLNEQYENKKQLLNIAIKRLTLVDKSTNMFQKERRIMNWEKLYMKLSEAKGHGRRWKFQIDTLKKKSTLSYQELISWVMREPREPNVEKEKTRNNKPNKDVRNSRQIQRRAGGDGTDRDQEKTVKIDADLREDDFGSKSKTSFKTAPTEEKKMDDNFMLDMDSDQDIFSDDSQRESKRSTRRKTPVITIDKTSQTEPDVETVACWTGEPNYTRYFIVRLFKPQEFSSKRVKFKITYGNTTFTSKNFETVKIDKKVKINEQQIRNRKMRKKEEEYDETKLDTSKYEDFVFELSDFIKKAADLNLNNEDCIQFEMKSEDKEAKETVNAYLNLPMDDVHTLELPILYYKDTEDAQIVEYYETPANKKSEAAAAAKAAKQDPSASWLRIQDMTTDAVDNYEILAKRIPYTFDMFKNKTIRQGHAVCKLPVSFFWIRKPWIFKLDKNTATQTLREIVDELTDGKVKINPIIQLAPLMPEPGAEGAYAEQTEGEAKPEDQAVAQITELKPAKGAKGGKTVTKTTDTKPQAASKPQPVVKTKAKTPEPPQVLVEVPDAIPAQEIIIKETMERGCSPIKQEFPPRPPSTPVRNLRNYDMVDIKQDLDSNQAQEMQETYRLKIDELNLTIYKLENELSQLRSDLAYRGDHSRLGKNRMSFMKPNNVPKVPDGPATQQEKSDLSFGKKTAHPNTSIDVKQMPKDFFARLKAFSEKSSNNHRNLMNKYMEEEANIIEQQMAVQHRLDTHTTIGSSQANNGANKYEDFCLPAVFMPFKSANSVFNPRAHQYFHPSGSNDLRLTQPPAIFQLPPLPPKSSISVINLFDLGRRYQAGEPDYYINEYIKREFVSKEQKMNEEEEEQEEQQNEFVSNSKIYLNETNLKNNL